MKVVIEHRLSQDQQDEEMLLKEYECARAAVWEIEKNVWQTAGVFVVLSLGGVSFLVTRDQQDWSHFILTTGIGIVSVLILWTWHGVVDRWWSVVGVLAYRIFEIEVAIGMWTARYIGYLDATRRQNQRIPENGDILKLARLDQAIVYYSKARVRRRIKLLTILLSISWLSLIAWSLMRVFIV